MTRKSRREVEAEIEELAAETSTVSTGGDLSPELKADLRTALRFRYGQERYPDNEALSRLLASAYADGVEQGAVTVDDLDAATAGAGTHGRPV